LARNLISLNFKPKPKFYKKSLQKQAQNRIFGLAFCVNSKYFSKKDFLYNVKIEIINFEKSFS
jgi:hypothetical protein